MDKAVYDFALCADTITRRNFTNVLEGLKPESVRQPGVAKTVIHRRSIIGAATTFELLAAKFHDSSNQEKVALFSPFIGGEVEGKFPKLVSVCLIASFSSILTCQSIGIVNIGLLVWSVTLDSEASLYKTLVDSTEVSSYHLDSFTLLYNIVPH